MDKKRSTVLLISPPFDEEEIVGETKSMKKVMNLIPPLGLCYIASCLEKKGYRGKVRIIDCQTGVSFEKLQSIFEKEKADVVGITCTTPSFESALQTGKKIKEYMPKAAIIIGGPHATALPEYTMGFGLFDYAVIGEGEETIVELMNYIDGSNTHQKLSEIKGIVYKDKNGKIVKTPLRPFIKDLNAIPLPARHLLPPPSEYHPTPASYRKLPQIHIMTSRGCPSQCTFCDRAVFGTRYRERSVKNIMKEIDETIKKYGVKDVKFFDDTFTINRKRLFEICKEMKKRNLKWCCLTKVNLVDYEMLRMMKKSGCYQVLFGIESGDDRILKLLKKGTTVEQNERAIRLAKKAGLNVRCDFIVGTPGQTMESMQKTVDFAVKMNPDFAHFNKFTPYPGTEMYKALESQGYKFDFSKTHSQLDHSMVMYLPPGINKEEYSKFLDEAFKRFYLRPRYILRQIMQIRTLQDLKRLTDGFFAIFKL
ncbi:MAG: radical SAM protein [Nanoarchaeota archaeon]|nr:radical SAM protein [Nanoarchaeota archaeon]